MVLGCALVQRFPGEPRFLRRQRHAALDVFGLSVLWRQILDGVPLTLQHHASRRARCLATADVDMIGRAFIAREGAIPPEVAAVLDRRLFDLAAHDRLRGNKRGRESALYRLIREFVEREAAAGRQASFGRLRHHIQKLARKDSLHPVIEETDDTSVTWTGRSVQPRWGRVEKALSEIRGRLKLRRS